MLGKEKSTMPKPIEEAGNEVEIKHSEELKSLSVSEKNADAKADNVSRAVLVAADQDSRTFSGLLPFRICILKWMNKSGRHPTCWAPGHASATQHL